MQKLLSIILLMMGCFITYAQKTNVKKEFRFAESQINLMLDETEKLPKEGGKVSPRTLENGQLKIVEPRDWTSGFFPGVLWYLYEYTGDNNWRKEAQKFTEKLSELQFFTGNHDLGFMVYNSYGHGYKMTKDSTYKTAILNAAKSLSTRFNPITGTIKSWDHAKDVWTYPVIIDNMMNLELLFVATKLSGDSSFYKLATKHANTTLKNHFRKDYSSVHVVDYSPIDGSVIQTTTHQGYSDESAWARGQAWGLYGYTMSFRETGDSTYLKQANHIANFIINNPKIPKDLIPYWDYDDPKIPDAPRDASAAAITSSALFELARITGNNKYHKTAKQILSSLSKYYKSGKGENKGFILDHSTGHLPFKSEINVPIIYADYYYLEALLRSKKNFKIGSL